MQTNSLRSLARKGEEKLGEEMKEYVGKMKVLLCLIFFKIGAASIPGHSDEKDLLEMKR